MRLEQLIRGPSRPTQADLRHRRRRAAALAALAALSLALGAIAGADGGSGGAAQLRAGARDVGWYGHLRTLAGAGQRSLDFDERVQESAAIDRTLAYTPYVRLGGAQHRLIALTFDDGPGPYTAQLIDTLQRLRVPGTFFIVGREIATFGPTTLQRQVDLGLPIGDHTQDHANLSFLSTADERAQVLDAAHAIAGAGAPLPRLFRPPYGAYDAGTFAVLHRQHMLMVLWTIDSEDYLRPGVATIVRNVVGKARPGAIVLMHDAGGERSQTIAALPTIVATLRRRGYHFVSVPRLLLENPAPRDQQLPAGFNSGGAG